VSLVEASFRINQWKAARIALEWLAHAGIDQPRSSDGARTEALAKRVGRFHGAPLALLCTLEQRQLLLLTQARCSHAQ
jgi:hypothetical protein